MIIEGDEGPLACQNVDCVGTSAEYLRIRLGNLVAMYLPGVDARCRTRSRSVNTFRTVFREYFGADLPPLPDRSFTWPDNDSHLRLPGHHRPARRPRRLSAATGRPAPPDMERPAIDDRRPLPLGHGSD